jgi:hypothetical protein
MWRRDCHGLDLSPPAQFLKVYGAGPPVEKGPGGFSVVNCAIALTCIGYGQPARVIAVDDAPCLGVEQPGNQNCTNDYACLAHGASQEAPGGKGGSIRQRYSPADVFSFGHLKSGGGARD